MNAESARVNEQMSIFKKTNMSSSDAVAAWATALFIFSASFSIFVSNFFMYLAVTAALFSIFGGGRFRRDEIYSIMLIFVAANIAALFIGGNGLAKISKVKNVMCFFGFFLAYQFAGGIVDKTRMMFLMLATNSVLLFTAVIITALGYTDIVYFQDLANWTHEYSGLFSITITYGEFLVMMQCIALAMLLCGCDEFGDPRLRGAFLAMIAVNMVALLLTFARGPWLAMALCAIVILASSRFKKLALYAAVFFMAGLLFIISPISREVPLLSDLNKRVAMTLQGYSSGREVIYAAGFQMIRDNPVLGLGIGGVEKNYSAYVNKIPGADEYRKSLVYGHLHNVYLQIWAECGLFGIVSFLYLLGYTFFRLWPVSFGRAGSSAFPGQMERAFARGAFMALFAMCLMGLTEYNFFHNELSRILWFYIGMALAPVDEPVI